MYTCCVCIHIYIYIYTYIQATCMASSFQVPDPDAATTLPRYSCRPLVSTRP